MLRSLTSVSSVLSGIFPHSSNVMEMRQKHKESFLKKHNVKLGFMSAFVKASAHALEEIPVVNAGRFRLEVLIVNGFSRKVCIKCTFS